MRTSPQAKAAAGAAASVAGGGARLQQPRQQGAPAWFNWQGLEHDESHAPGRGPPPDSWENEMDDTLHHGRDPWETIDGTNLGNAFANALVGGLGRAAPHAGSVPVPPNWALRTQLRQGAERGVLSERTANGGNRLPNNPHQEDKLAKAPPPALEEDHLFGHAGAFVGAGLGSPSPSTVDLHGPASLGSTVMMVPSVDDAHDRHTSSVPSLLSNGGPLELSDSLSNLTMSTNSSSKEHHDACGGGPGGFRQPSPTARACPAIVGMEMVRRAHDLGSHEVQQGALPLDVQGLPPDVQEEGNDENAPPDNETMPTPRMFEVQNAEVQQGEPGHSDPLAPTIKVVTKVKTMRSFWENQTRAASHDTGSPKDSLGVRNASNAQGGWQPCGRRSLSFPRKGTSNRVRKDIAKTQKLMEDSSALLEELALRVRGTGADVLRGGESGTSSSSDSEAITECQGDDDCEEVSLLRAYKASSSSLWRAHRQTVRLLLTHLDKITPDGHHRSTAPGGGPITALPDDLDMQLPDAMLREAEHAVVRPRTPVEPAGEPE